MMARPEPFHPPPKKKKPPPPPKPPLPPPPPLLPPPKPWPPPPPRAEAAVDADSSDTAVSATVSTRRATSRRARRRGTATESIAGPFLAWWTLRRRQYAQPPHPALRAGLRSALRRDRLRRCPALPDPTTARLSSPAPGQAGRPCSGAA